jgi:amino acid permease
MSSPTEKSKNKNGGNAPASPPLPLGSSATTDPLMPMPTPTNQNNNNNKAAYYKDPASLIDGSEVYPILLNDSSTGRYSPGGTNYGTDDSPPRRRSNYGRSKNDDHNTSSTSLASLPRLYTNNDNDESDVNLTHVFFGSIANLCSATLGAGVLALPYAFLSAGLVVGFILLLLSALATSLSIQILVKACAHYQIGTYEALVEHTCGKNLRTVTEVSIILFSGGCAVAYVIAVGDILEQSHMLLWNSRGYSMTLAWFLAMLPLSLLREMKSLQFASAVGIASIGTLVFAAFVHWMQDLETPMDDFRNSTNATLSFQDASISTRTLHATGNAASNPMDFLWPRHGIMSVVTACPIILFAFSCQVNVCAIYSELPDRICPDSDDDMDIDNDDHTNTPNSINGISSSVRINAAKEVFMRHVTWTAVGICSLLYGSISLIALSDLGSKVAPNILSSYEITGILRVACAAMAAAVIMAFPLNIFPARVTLEGIWENSVYCGGGNKRNGLLNQVQLLANGGVNAGDGDDDSNENNLTAGLLEVVDYVEYPPVPGAGDALESQESTVETSSIIIDKDWHPARHVFLTLLLAGMALALALVVPDISVVFGLLGGTTSSLLGFCVPGMLGLQLSRDTDDPSLKPVSWTLLIGGLVVGVLTTGVTLYHQFAGGFWC